MKLKLLQAATALFLALSSFATAPASAQNVGGGMMDGSLVSFINRSQRTLFLGFSPQPGRPVPFSWSPDCRRVSGQTVLPPGSSQNVGQILLAPGQTCTVSVPVSAGASRFCATENPLPPGKTPDCFAAQRENLTIIETNFTSQEGCQKPGEFPKTAMRSCVWYDINITPESCTNCGWFKNNCQDKGGFSYNVPVQLFCAGSATFTCQGPLGKLGDTPYPANCGAVVTQPDCIGGRNAACLQAYFYPMSTSGACAYPASKPQPIDRCPEGGKLFVIFPDGD
jgi:hypothetical protein